MLNKMLLSASKLSDDVVAGFSDVVDEIVFLDQRSRVVLFRSSGKVILPFWHPFSIEEALPASLDTLGIVDFPTIPFSFRRGRETRS